MHGGRARGVLPALLCLLIGTLTVTMALPPVAAPATGAADAADAADALGELRIEDPAGDSEHREFGWEEPTLDVTEVRFHWTADGTLQVSVLLPNADALGPDAVMDPFPGKWTVVDVYWTMDGADHLARAQFESDEPTYLAGQGIRIHRQVFWETGTDIHGETTEQSGWVEEADGGGHRVVIEVDPAAVGDPGPGDLLEAPAFSTWIDHHTPLGDAWPVPHPVGPHHPANADISDAPGLHFRVPGDGSAAGGAADGGDDASPASGETVPHVGVAVVLAAFGALALLRRRRR